MAKQLSVGDEAPNFDLSTTEGAVLMLCDEVPRNFVVLYFFGGLILGLGLLSGSLFVLAKLIVHAPNYLQGLSPVQAASPKLDHAQRPEIESGSERSPEQHAPISESAHTSQVVAVERPVRPANPVRLANVVRPANIVPARPAEEKKASGILEGIFQENLRIQRQIGRVAEAV